MNGKQSISCLLFIACVLTYQTLYAENILSERDALLTALKTLTSSDLSCNQNEDCATIGIGEKPCGGPLSYMPYSIKNPKLQEIQQRANLLRELDLKDNSENQRIGTCEAILPPNISCINHLCLTSEAGQLK